MNRRNEQGVTLIEMMIAMTIAIFLGVGVIQIFTSNNQTYRTQESMSRLQENARFALQFLADDIRMAGYFGCAGVDLPRVRNWVDTTNAVVGWSSEFDAFKNLLDGNSGALMGFRYTNAATMTADTSLYNATMTVKQILDALGMTYTGAESLVENTDLFIIRSTTSCPGSDVLAAPAGSAEMKIADNSSCHITQNDIVMVTNCQNADIFGVSSEPDTPPGAPSNSSQVTIAHGANWNSPAILSGEAFPSGSGISKMRQDVYFIGVGESGEPALFRRGVNTTNNTTNTGYKNYELVEGVEGMTITYGLDRSANPDKSADIYLPASSIAEAECIKVVALRITLQLRSLEDNITGEGDGRIHRSFSTTITIRNRAAG